MDEIIEAVNDGGVNDGMSFSYIVAKDYFAGQDSNPMHSCL